MLSFNLNKKPNLLIPTDILKYIKESTNKSMENYILRSKKNNESNLNSDLLNVHVYDNENNPNNPNFYYLLSFVSLFSFLAGYKIAKL